MPSPTGEKRGAIPLGGYGNDVGWAGMDMEDETMEQERRATGEDVAQMESLWWTRPDTPAEAERQRIRGAAGGGQEKRACCTCRLRSGYRNVEFGGHPNGMK